MSGRIHAWLESTPLSRLPAQHRAPVVVAGFAGVLFLAAVVGLIVVLVTRSTEQPVADAEPPPAELAYTDLPEASPESNPVADGAAASSTDEGTATPDIPSEPPPASDPLPAKSTPPETSPADPPPEPSQPAPAKPAETKPSPTKPAATKSASKSASAPQINPLEGFAEAVSLPPVESTTAEKLGPVRAPDNFLCLIYLLGGEGNVRGRLAFRSDNAEQGTNPLVWEIFARDTSRSAPEVVVARLERKAQELRFQWTPAAAEFPGAGSLANCALKISAGKGQQVVALRRPKQVNPLPIKYEKTTVSWDLPDTPRPDRTKIEFQVIAPKEMPRPRFLGQVVLPADKAETWVEFGLKPEEKFLKLQLEARLNAQALEVTMTPFFQLSGQAKPLALTEGNLKKARESLVGAAAPLEASLRALGPKPKSKKGKPVKSSDSDQRIALEKQLDAVREAEVQLKQLGALESKFAKLVRLQIRATSSADEAVIDLLEPRGK